MNTITQQTCSVIPPHIIRHAAAHSDGETRRRLQATESATRKLAAARVEPLVLAAVRQTPITPKRRIVYDACRLRQLPGRVIMTEEEYGTRDVQAIEAFNGCGLTHNYFADVLGRDSIDDCGMCLESTVHYGRGFDNAIWNGRQMIYGDGDRMLFNRFTAAIDIIGHELTHGVTQYAANLGYNGETGALNEHISDAFGILIKQYAYDQLAKQSDWVIGHGLFTASVNGRGLRSLADPGSAYDDPVLGRDPQPAHMRDYVVTTEDNGGVHINSGIPNRAFYLVASEASTYAWDLTGRIWYTALTSGLSSRATFADFAGVTIAAAARICGRGRRVHRLVIDAWASVGVKPTPSGEAAACLTVPLPQTRPAARGRLRWRRKAGGNSKPSVDANPTASLTQLSTITDDRAALAPRNERT
jgi:Zn-dependent metalloprotease